MNEKQPVENGYEQMSDIGRGLPMASARDAEALAKERAYLQELTGRSLLVRAGGYFKLSGPGWIQSALTLGGGSGSTSLFAGALAGYTLLWVQPTSMAIGAIMMGAMAYMTLSTGIRPFHAVNRYAHPVLGWGWALATLVANFIWIFGQFNVSASVFGDMVTIGGEKTPDFAVALGRRLLGADTAPGEAAGMGYGALACLPIALITLWVTWHYGRGSRGVRWFENAMKVVVGSIIICFAVVVFKIDTDWGEIFKGFFSFHKVPRIHETDKLDVVISMYATAVGINMTFLFPYTLLARGWGREHRGLAGFDLGFGMLIPFVFATSCLMISASNVLHQRLPEIESRIAQIEADNTLTQDQKNEQITDVKSTIRGAVAMSKSLEPLLGVRWSHIIFGLGFLGMTTSSIVTMMLVSGFTLCEICGGTPDGKAYKIGISIPALGLFGPLIFGKLQMWLMVPISVFCFFFIPIAYITFFVLMNNKRFLGEDCPRGITRLIWNTGMILAILVVTIGGAYKIYSIFNT
ncbi:MAG: divalent metal cation transporter [Planctomycetota bacterium]|nr:MAG: divalent metal cation transporter [Planctomycetota bacterium]